MSNVSIKTKLVILVLGVIIIWYIICTLPVSPGDFYGPFHVANLFFPNFGINFKYSAIPEAAKTLATFYVFNKILLILSGKRIMEYYYMVFLTDVLFRFPGYLLLFSAFPELRKFRIIFAMIFTIAINFPGIPVFLIASTLVELINLTLINDNSSKMNHLIVFIIILTMTALYWHTLSAVVAFIIFSYLSLLAILKRSFNTKTTRELYLFLISSTIIISSWIYLRSMNMLKVVLINFSYIQTLLQWKYIKLGLFGAGSLVPPEYRFDWQFPFPTTIINILRWVSYIVAYIFLTKLSFRIFSIKSRDFQMRSIYLITTALLISDVIDKLAHYFAIRDIGMTVWFVILYPLFFTYFLRDNIRNITQKYFSLRTFINLTVSLLFITSILLTSAYYAYTTATQLPSRNTPFNLYTSSLSWIVSHSEGDAKVLSDADTAGYYEVLYAKYEMYQHIPLYFRDIRLPEYDKLYRGFYNSTDKQLIVLNIKLYQKHLAFGSLRYWDRFKPLPPQKMFKNRVQVIYNDESFMIGG